MGSTRGDQLEEFLEQRTHKLLTKSLHKRCRRNLENLQFPIPANPDTISSLVLMSGSVKGPVGTRIEFFRSPGRWICLGERMREGVGLCSWFFRVLF